MQQRKGNPATLAARGVPVADLAGASIIPESINDRPLTQERAKQLARAVFSTPPAGMVAVTGNNGLPYWVLA